MGLEELPIHSTAQTQYDALKGLLDKNELNMEGVHTFTSDACPTNVGSKNGLVAKS